MRKFFITSLIFAVIFSLIPVPAMAQTNGYKPGESEESYEILYDDTLDLAPVSEEFLNDQGGAQYSFRSNSVEADEFTGLRHDPLKVEGDGLAAEPSNRSRYSYSYGSGLPSSYDLRDYGKVTAMRNQGPNGSCWAFASYGSLESTMLPQLNDFSEKHMRNTHGFDWGPNDGGTRAVAAAYLARWSGPIAESDDPYHPRDFRSPSGLVRTKDLMKAIYLPDARSDAGRDVLKRALMQNGAMYTTIIGSKRYLSRYNAHYYSGSGYANHAITLIGWDDNFSARKFNSRPPGNGAWLCKNSWGTNFGDRGYYWVSYYDKHIGTSNCQFIAQDKGEFDNIYQYDTLGMTTTTGRSSGYFANVFTAKATEYVNAVGVFTNNHNTRYDVYMVTNYSGPGSFGNRVKVASGTIPYAGYYVIKIDPQLVQAGTKFAPVVHFSTSGSRAIPVEAPRRGYSSRARASSGQSYISHDGRGWSDLTRSFRNANVCLKAFTGKGSGSVINVPVTSVDIDYKTGSVKKGNRAQLTATVAPSNATNKNVTWTSSNPSVVSVDQTGIITGVNYGTAVITVTTADGGHKSTSTITVPGGTPAPTSPGQPTTKPTTRPTTTVAPVQNAIMTISPSKSSYNQGETIEINSVITDYNYRGIPNVDVEYHVTSARNNIKKNKTTDANGKSTLTMSTSSRTSTGEFVVVATAKQNGRVIATGRTTFNIVSRSSGRYDIVVNASTNKQHYQIGERINLRANIKNGSGYNLSYSTVRIELTLPNGSTHTFNRRANYYGSVYFPMSTSRSNQQGRYTIKVTGTRRGYRSGSTTVSFILGNVSPEPTTAAPTTAAPTTAPAPTTAAPTTAAPTTVAPTTVAPTTVAPTTVAPTPGQNIYTKINTDQGLQLINDNKTNPNFVIVDLRRPEEYKEGYIPAAINVNFYASDFKAQLARLDRNKKYMIYCRTDNRSLKSLAIMQQLNFKEVHCMLGGINQWMDEGKPITMPKPPAPQPTTAAPTTAAPTTVAPTTQAPTAPTYVPTTVSPNSNALIASVKTNKDVYRRGDFTRYTANVKLPNGRPAYRARVVFTVTRPNGTTFTRTRYTNRSGIALLGASSSYSTAHGIYTVVIEVSGRGYSSSTASYRYSFGTTPPPQTTTPYVPPITTNRPGPKPPAPTTRPGPRPPAPTPAPTPTPSNVKTSTSIKLNRNYYKQGHSIIATITVHDNNSRPVSGANVSLVFKFPSGKTETHNLTTNSYGQATYSRKTCSKTAPVGYYNISVTAQKGGYQPSSDNVQFYMYKGSGGG